MKTIQKSVLGFVAGLVVAALLVSCGGSQYGSNADYGEVILAVQDPEIQVPLITSFDEAEDPMNIIGFMGLNPEDIDRFALSTSVINTRAHSICIILPVEGRGDAIVEQLEQFSQAQQNAFDGYLLDQYQIAQSAVVEVASTGEVLFAMTGYTDGETVVTTSSETIQAIKDALTAA